MVRSGASRFGVGGGAGAGGRLYIGIAGFVVAVSAKAVAPDVGGVIAVLAVAGVVAA